MILYTPLALEEVLANHQEAPPERFHVTLEGKMFYVDKSVNGEYKLAQLLSTDPNDYLNTNYNPGGILS